MCSRDQILNVIATLRIVHAGRLVEIRGLGVPEGTEGRTLVWGGYFDDYELAAKAALELDEKGAEGVYMTIGELHPGLIARAPNRLVRSPRCLTTDADVIAQRWALIDIDPIRPAGISSSHDELENAMDVQDQMVRREAWNDRGCTVVTALSGNGTHILVSGNSDAGPYEVVRLDELDARYGDAEVRIDASVGNPSRICRLYGTTARKGFATPERPHRRSFIMGVTERT